MIRVLIADDHHLVRKGIIQILADERDIEVVGEAGNNRQVLTAIRENHFDVLLLDISMPDGGGLDLLEELHKLKPNLKILMLTMYSEKQYASRALRSHAYGYITKESAPEELIAAIRKVARGEKYISEAMTQVLVQDYEKRATHEDLSTREFQILRKLAAGKTPTEIAKELSISIKTVSTYRARIMAKLQLKNTAEIIRYAIQHDLLE
jgi:two-component system invasion response regulator UvrY